MGFFRMPPTTIKDMIKAINIQAIEKVALTLGALRSTKTIVTNARAGIKGISQALSIMSWVIQYFTCLFKEEIYHFNQLKSSMLTDNKSRYTVSTKARPTTTSAAATAITNTPNTCPTTKEGSIKRLKATRLMMQALSISSMPMRIEIAFFLARAAYKPTQNNIPASNK
jgi:hypothetical protein